MNTKVISTIAAAMLTFVQPVFAGSYPEHPVKIIHGFGPGGTAGGLNLGPQVRVQLST